MSITLDRSITQDFTAALAREWLETNGLGGWASSTLCGAHSRRYHGLLVAATRPPVGRMVLLSKLDETIEVNGERFELGSSVYPGAIHPRGFEFLEGFSKDLFPVFHYKAAGIQLDKTIVALHGENTTLVVYEVLASSSSFVLELLPLVAGRDYHSLVHANPAIRREARFEDGIFRAQPYQGVPELFIAVPGASYRERAEWYFNFEYPVEGERGLDCREDLFSYGIFRTVLQAGDRLAVIISTRDPAGRDALALLECEKERRLAMFDGLQVKDDLSKKLALAADQFVVQRGNGLRTLIAGYHWFTDWGRDTMIALPGITLTTGRFEDARNILQTFAANVSQGMLPNRFPDAGEEPEYNTVDAALWFFVAGYKYLQYSGDLEFVRTALMPVLEDIIAWHDRGTRYGIHVDGDGLLAAGEPGLQLTWMDAKIGDWVVTPRKGKPVEINALWYNALKILSYLHLQCGDGAAARAYENRAERVRQRFHEVFWNPRARCLYDCVDGDTRDAAVRPNQIFALSLPYALLSGECADSVLQTVDDHLLTPFGLRSLAPDHPEYRPHYGTDSVSRDSAYHQGTVWGWLLGPYISALVRVKGEQGRGRARSIIDRMAAHLDEAGLGTLSEIFDAEPPHAAKGCVAQAWSVAEVLRAYTEDVCSVRQTNVNPFIWGVNVMNKTLIKRLSIVALLLGAAIVFRAYHLEQYFSLPYIKGSHARFAALYAEHQLLVIGTYFAIYVAVTALSLPGAAVMTLAGGGLFGLPIGLVVVSFASSIGATLACAVSRFVLRDWVQGKFGDKLATINEGVEKEGAFYLFTLRLVPIFPFFVINLLMGLTPMKLRTFYGVSQLGMLAGTIVYVNAGKELANIDTLSGILSPSLLVSFAILGLFPVTVKKLLALYRCRIKRACVV